MKVVDPDTMDPSQSSSPQNFDSEDEELMRMRYFEALRQQHYEEQMRQMHGGSRSGPFHTPDVMAFNYDDLYSYGSEMNTASANYRPGNSNTLLRRKLPKKSNNSN